MVNSAIAAMTFVPGILLPSDPVINVQQILRWIHFSAGITWVGLLYFFNLVSIPLMKELDPATRGKIFPALMSRAMWWFRWSAVVTVLAGFGYWTMIVAADARNAGARGGFATWTFLAIWTLAFFVEMGVVMSPSEALKRGPVLGSIVGITLSLAGCVYVALNSHGWESNRLLSIGIGGGLGWFMMFNVWGIIWRIQKKLIRWTEDNTQNGTPMPPEAAKLARIALTISRVNFVLSFPMLFFMAAASHYPMFVVG